MMQLQVQRKLRKIDDEEWREVPNTNQMYYVSSYGRLKSYQYCKEGEILKSTDVHGFKLYQLSINNVRHKKYAHRLVAELWLEKKSENANYVGHKDGNLKNNHFTNLEWFTKEELVLKRREITKMKAKSGVICNINNSKLNESDVKVLKGMLNRGIVQSTIAKLFRISEMQVTRIKRGENWGHVKI